MGTGVALTVGAAVAAGVGRAVAVVSGSGVGVTPTVPPAVAGISHTKCFPTMQEKGFHPFGSYGNISCGDTWREGGGGGGASASRTPRTQP